MIGINQYQHASPLSYAVNDAEAVRDVLRAELHFPAENISFLSNADATKERVLRSFLRFSGDDIEVDDRIVVFFAGHGHTRTGIKGEVGYLVPHDADTRDCSSLIRWDDLTRNAELVRAKHILFIMDACYGGLALVRNLGSGSTRFLKDMMRRFARQVLTAGKADEVVADSGGPIANHSVFTGHLIQGLQGSAANEQGVITANSLMAYVHNKVAHDNNSHQTPHYGYFDGDGDFIISAPQLLASQDEDKESETDQLFAVPFTEDAHPTGSSESKVLVAKRLLASDSSAIELHDLMIEEVKRFLSETTDDHFKVQGQWSQEEFLERMARYERATSDLCGLLACMSYWAKPSHQQILQKFLARSTDRLQPQAGLSVWANLRWYPIILEMYYAGVAAVEGQRYDSLASIFSARAQSSKIGEPTTQAFVDSVVNAMLELNRQEVFKRIPGHERHYAPLSEYFFKLLQPKLDDILFVGQGYERSFDEFEILLALVVADSKLQTEGHMWGPAGRFGWKHRQWNDSPLTRVVDTARKEGANWPPLRTGLFGGDFQRFLPPAEEYVKAVDNLGWY